jgi:hypothetical protein
MCVVPHQPEGTRSHTFLPAAACSLAIFRGVFPRVARKNGTQ